MNKKLLISFAVFVFAVAGVSFLLTDSVSDAAASVNSFQKSAQFTPEIDIYVASGPNDFDQSHNTNGLYVGYDDDPDFDLQSTRTYLQFDLTSLANKVATGPATLELYLNFTTFESLDQTMEINIHEVKGELINKGITWENQPDDSTLIASQQVGTASGDWITWTIPKEVIERWIDFSTLNIGLVLISPDGETPGTHLRNFRSKEFENGRLAPKLNVSFADPTPVPIPPTNTPAPTNTPIPTPTNVPTPAPRLSLEVENDPPGQVNWDEVITYTISYSNRSEADITLNDVVITGSIPISTTLEKIFPSGAISTTNEVRFDVGSLSLGQGGQLTYSVKVNTQTTQMAISTIPMMNVITTPTDSMKQGGHANRSTITSFRSNVAIVPATEPRMTPTPPVIIHCAGGSSDQTSSFICTYNGGIRLWLPVISR